MTELLIVNASQPRRNKSPKQKSIKKWVTKSKQNKNNNNKTNKININNNNNNKTNNNPNTSSSSSTSSLSKKRVRNNSAQQLDTHSQQPPSKKQKQTIQPKSPSPYVFQDTSDPNATQSEKLSYTPIPHTSTSISTKNGENHDPNDSNDEDNDEDLDPKYTNNNNNNHNKNNKNHIRSQSKHSQQNQPTQSHQIQPIQSQQPQLAQTQQPHPNPALNVSEYNRRKDAEARRNNNNNNNNKNTNAQYTNNNNNRQKSSNHMDEDKQDSYVSLSDYNISDLDLLELAETHQTETEKKLILEKNTIFKFIKNYGIKTSNKNFKYLYVHDEMVGINLMFNKINQNTTISTIGKFDYWWKIVAKNYNIDNSYKLVHNSWRTNNMFSVFISPDCEKININEIIDELNTFCNDWNYGNLSPAKKMAGRKTYVSMYNRFHAVNNHYAIKNVPVQFTENGDEGIIYFKKILYTKKLQQNKIRLSIERATINGHNMKSLKITTPPNWTLNTFNDYYDIKTTKTGHIYIIQGFQKYQITTWHKDLNIDVNQTESEKLLWYRQQHEKKLNKKIFTQYYLVDKKIKNKLIQKIWRKELENEDREFVYHIPIQIIQNNNINNINNDDGDNNNSDNKSYDKIEMDEEIPINNKPPLNNDPILDEKNKKYTLSLDKNTKIGLKQQNNYILGYLVNQNWTFLAKNKDRYYQIEVHNTTTNQPQSKEIIGEIGSIPITENRVEKKKIGSDRYYNTSFSESNGNS